MAALCAALGACTFADRAASIPPPLTAPGALPSTVWAPQGAPRAVVLALHGFNDHRGAFALFGAWAAARGILVEAYDQRSFGENPDRGHWPGTAVLVADAQARLHDLHRRYPDVPVFLLGTSMGAAVAILAATDKPPAFLAGVILSAPAVWGGTAMNPFYRAVLWLAARLFPDLRVTGESLKRQASDNLEVLRALARDPLFIRQTRIAAIEGLVELMGDAFLAAGRLALPVLILVGQRDQIIPVDVQLDFARRVQSAHCTLMLYPEGWHLLLRDLQRQRVYADIEAWMEGLPAPSGLARACRESGLAARPATADIADTPRP